MQEKTLPQWTWVIPNIALLLATIASVPFAIYGHSYTYFFASALALPMALWWGPRVIFASFLNALLACFILDIPQHHLYPVFALPGTLETFIGWALVRERVKTQGLWTSSPRNVLTLALYGVLIPLLISTTLLHTIALFAGILPKEVFFTQIFNSVSRQFFCGLMLTMPLVILFSPPLFRKKLSLFPTFERVSMAKLNTNRQFAIVAALGISIGMSIFMQPRETWSLFAIALLGASLWSGLFFTTLLSSWFLFITGILYKTQFPISELDPHSVVILSTIALSSLLCSSALTYVKTSELALKRTETDLREAKEDALEASQAKTDFLERMSHELRSPLNSVLGTLDLLRETDLNPEQQSYLKLFHHAGENLKALINDLLDYSNIEMKKIKLEESPYNLRDTLRSVIEILQVKAEEKGIIFDLQLPEVFPYQQVGDGTRLRQILFNLLGNSIKFSQSSEVSFSLSLTPKNEILINIRDHGEGISRDPDKISKHGLGLVIARNLTETMGGRLSIQGQTGRGTQIELILPNKTVSYISDENLSLKPDIQFIEETKEPYKILLVDDSEDNRILIKYYLKSLPIEFTEAENGEDAIEAFKKQKFDLVFMDMQMPRMSGYKATEIIRLWEEQEARDHTPIIALTGTAIADELKKAIKAGCNQYMIKPASKKQILETLSKHLKPAKGSGSSQATKTGL